MSLATLLQTGWAVYRRTRLIWVFALIMFIFGALDHFLNLGSSDALALVIVLVVWFINLYGEAGTIYSAGSALEGQPASFAAAQRVFVKSLLRVVILSAIPAVLISVLPSLILTAIIQSQPVQPNMGFVTAWLSILNLVFILFAALVYPFIFYCNSGVILHNGSLLGSLRRGWRIFTHNLGVSLRVALLFFAAWLVLRSAATGIALLLPGTQHSMAEVINQDVFGAVLYVMLSGAGEIASLVFFVLLLDPLKRIMLANIYLGALGAAPVPTQPEAQVSSPA